jgi:enoyl-CoA hydratase/carnithine racemase
MAEVLVSETRAGVRMLRLNRPERLNALDTDLTRALVEALRSADEDGSIRAVLLSGNGRAFCAGADTTEFTALSAATTDAAAERADLTSRLHIMLQRLTKPIVSAVQGAAMGGGAGLAIGCDMMVATTDIKFGYPELRHGLVPAIVMTGLQRQFGRKTAFELISLGRLLGAQELTTYGLANRVVPPEEVFDTAFTIAETWAAADPRAMAATKSLFYRVADLPFDAAMAAGRDVNALMRRPQRSDR